MLDLEELKQLTAFAELGTLSKVAEAYHISTPSMTRAMQHLEDEFGVPLFIRGKNRIELSDTGKIAVEYGRKLLSEADRTVSEVRAFEQRRRTITIRSCAPAPLWELLRKLNTAYPDKIISSSIGQNAEVEHAWREEECDMAILPYALPGENAQVFMREKLFVSVPSGHRLAEYDTLTFADINGFNFLLRSELGFWDTLCRNKMPASRFLVQADEFTFYELVKASSLPCFTTDYVYQRSDDLQRVNIPLTDPEADVSFYLMRRGEKEQSPAYYISGS